MEHKVRTKALSWLLTLAMVVGMLPGFTLPVSAATSVSYQEALWDGTKVVYTTKTADATPVTSSTTTMSAGWYVVDSNVTVSGRIEINGAVHLILCDGKTLTVTDGITLQNNNSLSIYGQTENTGKLAATATTDIYSGIGPVTGVPVGDFVMHGGTVVATGASSGCGIGGSGNSPGFAGGNVTVYGGNLRAIGSYVGAGIGGNSSGGQGGAVRIYGGTVYAEGKSKVDEQYYPPILGGGSGSYEYFYYASAGIGGGEEGDGGTVEIYGGTVEAVGGGVLDGKTAYGIGSGLKKTNNGTLTIAQGATITTGTNSGSAAIKHQSFAGGVLSDGDRTPYMKIEWLHSHSWSYAASNNTITATCNGEGTCPVGEKTLTLNAPDAAYTGSAYSGASLSNAWTAANDMTAPGSIQYEGVSPTSYAKSTTAPTDVGTYEASVTVGTETATKQFSITKANISPTVSMAGWTYGDTASEPSVSGNTGNGDMTYQYKVSTADDSTYTTTKPTAAGTYTVKATIAETANYNGGTATADFTIAKKSLTPTLTGSVSKTYDGTMTAATDDLSITLDGVVNSDDVSATIGSATFDNANVGENKTVTASGIALAGGTAGNYTLSATTASDSVGTITAKALTQSDVTIIIDPASYVWTGSPIEPTNVTVKLGDTELPDTEYDVAYTDNTNIGTAVATFTFKHNCSGTATANYSITKAAPTYTAPTANSGLIYNKTAQELITAGSTADGTFYYRLGSSGAWSAELPKATNAGSYAVSYYVKGDSDHSDVGSEASPISLGAVAIAPKEVGLTWENTAFSYDGNAHIPTATATNLETGDTCTVTVMGAKADAGSHTAEATALSNANYKLPASATQNFTISGAKVVNNDGSAVTAPKNGDALKAVLSPTDDGDSYQWYRGNTAISGATEKTYTLGDDDVGKNIKAVIKKGGTEYPSAPVGPVAQVHSIVVAVTSEAGTDVTLKLMKGAAQIGVSQTVTLTGSGPYTGTGTFTDVPDGVYNIVATQGTKTVTAAVTLTAAETTKNVTVTMPSGDVNSKLDVKNDGVPSVVAGGLDKEAEKNKEDGHNVTITMTVENESAATSEATAIQAQAATTETAGKGAPTMTYLDITVTKQVDADPAEPVHETTDVIELIIPFPVAGRTVWMWRNHQGSVQTLLNNTSHGEGTFWTDAANDLIHVYAKKYSVYAIGYVEGAISNTPTSSGVGSGWTALPTRYQLETERTEHGTTEVSHKEASTGTKVIITPRPDKGYEAASATVRDKDGKLVPVTKEKDGTWSFTMPSGKVTISVSYSRAVVTPADTGVADWLITDEHIAYLNGYDEDGVLTIHPKGNITRAEVAAIFYRLLRNKNVAVTKSYADVPESEWYAQAVGVLSSLGILNGYDEGDFRPRNPITRAEFATIATRFAKATGGTAGFLDVPGSHWAHGNIATAADYGWVSGYGDGNFGPNGNITRAEVAAIVNRMLGRKADQEWVRANQDKLKSFSDLRDAKQWYYFDMIEASNAHDFTIRDGVETWTK